MAPNPSILIFTWRPFCPRSDIFGHSIPREAAMTTHIRLAHSPDADDAFMFYGLAKDKIDTQGIQYEHVLKDIQTLNEWAKEGRMEVTAISAHAYAYVKDKYAILTHGGSIGKDYGPMSVAGEDKPLEAFR